MSKNKTALKFFGLFFILSFVSYAMGSAMVESSINTPVDFSRISQHKNRIIIGALLIVCCHTLTNIGLAVIAFSVFKDRLSIQACLYLCLAITSTVFLAIGGGFLLLILPLAEWTTDKDMAGLAGKILQKGQFYCYQFGMVLWSVGGGILCSMLLQTRAVGKWLSVWGLIGYGILLIGCVAEIFGQGIGTSASVVGGLFEVTLSLLAVFRGFRPLTPIARG